MAKAKISYTDKGVKKTEEVMFNPPELKISVSNNYADPKTPGDGKEKKQFTGKNNETLEVTLFFDYTRLDALTRLTKDPDNKGISSIVDPIIALSKIPKNAKAPPIIEFAWGSLLFPSVIVSISQKYDYFDSSGKALRAELGMKLQRYEPEEKTAGGAKAKTGLVSTVVQAGQDLMCFCVDPKDWRPLAEANNIDNPLTVENGGMVGELLYTPAY